MKFWKLVNPIVLTKRELPALGEIYPHELFSYINLGEAARSFLDKNFSVWTPYMEVVGITNHNGHGRQWGIILFHYPNSEEWKIVAQFGHWPGELRPRIWFARWLARFLQHRCYAFNRPRRLDEFVTY